MMKKLINYLLGLLGYRIDKIRIQAPPARTMEEAIRKLAEGYQISSIIDVGASNGLWTRMALNYFPNSKYLLVEAQPAHLEALTEFVSTRPNVEFVLSAAGDRQGHIYFDASDPFGGQASRTPYKHDNIEIPVTTIDYEVNARGLPGKYLLKLDTHGFEVPIFEGASATLEKTEIVIVECYNFKISPECLLFHEMCGYLDGKGFRCIDLADPMWRPYDNSFWQMDLVFVRKDNPQFSYAGYQ
jgi:FkbM family methyltransferase